MARPAQGQRRPTLQDIADTIGVTANTVSRALNDMPGVSVGTRERVKAEAKRIGYLPNANARSLVLGSRRAIGMVVTNISNPFFAELVGKIELEATTAGYTVQLFLSDESPEREEEAVDAALNSGVDGLIGVPVQGHSNPWLRVTRAGVPLVLVSREMPELAVDLFSAENELGMYKSASALLDLGARHPVLVEEDLPITTIQHRIEGFRRALRDHGMPVDERRIVLVPSRRSSRGAALPWQASDAQQLASDLLERGRPVDAFVVGNDFFALGIYRALREHGLSVPRDAMVMGWGNYPFTLFMEPPLSTLVLPTDEIARGAVARLLARLDGTAMPGIVTERFEPELVLRGSTAR